MSCPLSPHSDGMRKQLSASAAASNGTCPRWAAHGDPLIAVPSIFCASYRECPAFMRKETKVCRKS